MNGRTIMEQQNKNETFRKFLRFSGIGIQLGASMYIASLLGEWLDAKFELETKWFSLLFVVIALIAFIYSLVKQLNKLNNDN